MKQHNQHQLGSFGIWPRGGASGTGRRRWKPARTVFTFPQFSTIQSRHVHIYFSFFLSLSCLHVGFGMISIDIFGGNGAAWRRHNGGHGGNGALPRL